MHGSYVGHIDLMSSKMNVMHDVLLKLLVFFSTDLLSQFDPKEVGKIENQSGCRGG